MGSILLTACNSGGSRQAQPEQHNMSIQQQIKINLSKVALPNFSKVGYWSNLNTTSSGQISPTMQVLASAGYNIIPIAFGNVTGNNVSLYTNGYNNNGYGIDGTQDGFIKDIAAAHASGAKILLSLGSGAKIWQPDAQNPQALAASIINYLKSYNLDGVDFDLEDGDYADEAYLAKLIGSMRQLATTQDFPNGFTVIGVPQIITKNYPSTYSSLYIAWNGGAPLDNLMKQGACNNYNCFDALDIQNYNNGDMEQQAGQETNGNTVLGAYDIAYQQINQDGNNNTTKIIIGHPATTSDGQFSTSWSDLVKDLSAMTASSTPQFAGVMVWTASSDVTSSSPYSIINSLAGFTGK